MSVLMLNRKKERRLCTVLKKKISGGCEGRPILFWLKTIYLSPKLREKCLIFKTANQIIFFQNSA